MLQDTHEFERHLVIDGDAQSRRGVEETIVAEAGELRFEGDDLAAIRLGVREALENAHCHGNAGDVAKPIEIDYTIAADEVRVRIADQGDGFDFDSLPDPRDPGRVCLPGGRGVFLMRHYMTGVRFDRCGNRVEIWRRRRGCAGPTNAAEGA